MKKALLTAIMSVSVYAQTCTYNGYDINEHPTTKSYTFTVACAKGTCHIQGEKASFSVSEKRYREKLMRNCSVLQKEIYNFNTYVLKK